MKRNQLYYATRETAEGYECHLSADKAEVIRWDAVSFIYLKSHHDDSASFDNHVKNEAKLYNMIRIYPEKEIAKREYDEVVKQFGKHPNAGNFSCLVAVMIKYQNVTLDNTSRPITNTEAIKIASSVDWINLYKKAGVKL